MCKYFLWTLTLSRSKANTLRLTDRESFLLFSTPWESGSLANGEWPLRFLDLALLGELALWFLDLALFGELALRFLDLVLLGECALRFLDRALGVGEWVLGCREFGECDRDITPLLPVSIQIKLHSELTSLSDASSLVPIDPLSQTLYDRLEMLSAFREDAEFFFLGALLRTVPLGLPPSSPPTWGLLGTVPPRCELQGESDLLQGSGESLSPREGSGDSPRNRLHLEVLSEIRDCLPALIVSNIWLSVREWVVCESRDLESGLLCCCRFSSWFSCRARARLLVTADWPGYKLVKWDYEL